MDKRLAISLLILALLLGIGVGVLFAGVTMESEVIVEREVVTVTKYVEKPYIKFHSVNIHELMILLRITEAEATGGTVNQKVNVAHAVLNRVRSDRFPNTIEEVVFEEHFGRHQFSPVADGRFYKVSISKETILAVDKALKGENYHESSFFFVRKDSGENNVSWFDEALEFAFNDGLHEFRKVR